MQKNIHTSAEVYDSIEALASGNPLHYQFYSDLVALYESYLPALFIEFPQLDGKPADLLRIYSVVKQAGGFRNFVSLSQAQQAELLNLDESQLEECRRLYIRFLLLYEEADQHNCISQDTITFVKSFFPQDHQAFCAESSQFEYYAMHIPAFRVDRDPEEFIDVRRFHYDNIPFGCLPVVYSEKFGIEMITGRLCREQQSQFIDVIEGEDKICRLCNYLLQYPDQFFRTSRICYLMQQLQCQTLKLPDFVLLADTLSHVAEMFCMDDQGVIFEGCTVPKLIYCIKAKILLSPQLIQVIIRLLANLRKCNDNNQTLKQLIYSEYQFLINFVLLFARSEIKTAPMLYTFSAALFLIRTLLNEDYDDELVFVLLEAFDVLLRDSNKLAALGAHNVFEILLDLLESEQYDAVLVFMHERMFLLDQQAQERVASIIY